MTEFTCNLSDKAISLPHSWEHTVGSGHAPLALRADYRAQLARCHRELGFQHVRFHAILSDEMGTLICQNEKFLYSFFNADSIMDYLLSMGMRPFVELSFMPETLASGSKIVFHYRAHVTPPKDYGDWATLIHKLVAHWVERYSIQEVSQWFFEVWNEPNLTAFWTGKLEDYFKLYQTTVRAIKEVDASLKVGGPVTAQNAWIPEFLERAEQENLPVDFVSTHYYPTDAFGKESTDTITQLANAPRDVMRQRAQESFAEAKGKPVYYTEWNITSNPRDPFHDEPFAAAYATNIILNVARLVDGYSWWTFSDIFAENYFPSMPFQGGFGLLNIHGIAKPVYRAFELLHRLGDELLPVVGAHETVSAWVSRTARRTTWLLTNHAQPRHSIHTELVKLCLDNAPPPQVVYIERIDGEHCNPRRTWQELGQPEYLSPHQVEQLQAVSQLTQEPIPFQFMPSETENAVGQVRMNLFLPPHSVAAITIE